MGVKVLSASGSGSGSDIVAGIDWCNSKKGEYNIVVTTMSIGEPDAEYTREDCPNWADSAINAAHDLGITVTIASGNDGFSQGISYPACSPNALSVGSTTKSDTISSFSNTGDILDVLAPGSEIYSTIPGGYASFNGTSMATPHVAGAVALLKQYLPSASPDEIEEALKTTGKMVTDSDNGLAFPRIDVKEAITGFIECFSNSDCGSDTYSGDSFCLQGDIQQNYTTYTCSNPGTLSASCSDLTEPEITEECDYGCVPVRCKIKVCNYGKCYYV